MKTNRLLSFFIVWLFFVGVTYSQEKNNSKFYRTIDVNLPFDSVYTKTIDYLQEHGYFILSLNKESGFIQAKIYTADNKITSDKMGDKDIYNFIIRSRSNISTKVSLSIYLERSFRRSVNGGWTYYDRDIGIYDNNHKLYNQILSGLNEWY